MKVQIVLLFSFLTNFYSRELTLDEAVVNSPFEIASLGWTITFPNEDAILIRGKGEAWKQWFKVDLIKNDTVLFIDSIAMNWRGDDLFINSMIFSKDGKRLLIGTDKKQKWRYSHSATFYIYSIMNKKLRPVSENNRDLRNVKFSPDANFVSYVREDNNLYLFNLKNNRERQLTRTGSKSISNGHFGWLYEEELTGYDGYRWSPDSKYIAFWEEDQKRVPEFLILNQLSQYPSITKMRYPKAGENNPTMKIGLIRVKGAGNKWIEKAFVKNDYLPWMEWIDNEHIAYLKMDRSQKNWDMYISNRKNAKSKKILSESDPNGWLDNHKQIRFLKDGRIIWISEYTGFKHLWMSKHSGSKTWPITEGKWEVSKIVHIDEEKETIFFISNKESHFENRFYSIRFDGTDLKLLTKEIGNHSIRLSGSKSYFIDIVSSLQQPKIIKLKELASGRLIRVMAETDTKQFDEYGWSEPKIVNFPSLDSSVMLNGKLILPKDYDPNSRYPVIVHGYGMPGTQIVWNKWGSIWSQYLSQNGYIVFSMDARGMSGRGEKFKNLSYGDMSKYLTKDHVAGVKYLINNAYADSNRIGAWGWSGGGYFACLMLTRNGEYFKAGIAVAPCTDFRLYDTAYTERYMGLPNENKSGYDSTNVMSWLYRMKGSLLLMHGEEDDNVHYQHTAQFVDRALSLNKDVEWYVYPGRNHGIYGGGSRKHLYKKMIEYFNENL